MKNYIVKEIVTDYRVYIENKNGEDELLLILNSRDNAELICEILHDDDHKKFGICEPISYKKRIEQNIEWYKMWQHKYQEEIEDLKTELETYRPTKLHGNGQCECYSCKQKNGWGIHWTNWCSKYKGHIYCDNCLKEILKGEQECQKK